MVIGRFAGWLKGMAVGAAVAALVAVPMVGQGAGIVGVNDLAYGGGGCTGKVTFQDFHFAKVAMQDFHFTKVQSQDFHFAAVTFTDILISS